jgi:hypothetical protein
MFTEEYLVVVAAIQRLDPLERDVLVTYIAHLNGLGEAELALLAPATNRPRGREVLSPKSYAEDLVGGTPMTSEQIEDELRRAYPDLSETEIVHWRRLAQVAVAGVRRRLDNRRIPWQANSTISRRPRSGWRP